ncbi:MAG: sulfotransferase domain-containing protein [Rhodobacteraceae bacterium]|nr:sulfotransferase domain-containing protein [Paracoccaceae bacterium]
MFAELPVEAITYNHAIGRVTISFQGDQFQGGCPVSLLVAGVTHQTTSQHLAATATTPERIVAVFNNIWLTSISDEVLLISRLQDQAAFYPFYPFNPDQHKLLHWHSINHAEADLTLLVSFPRSGSNFLQNIVRDNTKQLGCASIYQSLSLTTPKILLKSHALNFGVLRKELTTLWDIAPPRFKRIVLVRDPRDVFISLYDYVTALHGAEIDPATFLIIDFYWHLYRPHMNGLVRGKQTRALTVLQAYQTWFRTWITGADKFPRALHVRFEELVSDPQTGFAPVFKLLDEPMPDPLASTAKLVSQIGESPRRRGQSQGWRTGPGHLSPDHRSGQ